MKPNLEINKSTPRNADLFDNAFFRRFSLRPMPEPLQLNADISRQYQFPTFYGDVTCAIGIFLCDYQAAQRRMVHPEIKPIKMTRGRSLVIFSCYEYRNVHEVGSYNEIAMTIPVMVRPAWNPPVLPMLLQSAFSSFGYHVFSMPVTSLENQIRGEKIWGLPKVVQRIDIDASGNEAVTEAYDEGGNKYLTLRVPKSGRQTRFDVASNLYIRKGDQLLQAQTCFQGDFAVNKNMGLLFRRGRPVPVPALELGDSPEADVLRQLKMDPEPFQFRFAQGMSACFDLPNPDYRSPIQF